MIQCLQCSQDVSTGSRGPRPQCIPAPVQAPDVAFFPIPEELGPIGEPSGSQALGAEFLEELGIGIGPTDDEPMDDAGDEAEYAV